MGGLALSLPPSRGHPTNASCVPLLSLPSPKLLPVFSHLPLHLAPLHFLSLLPLSLPVSSNSQLKIAALSPAPHSRLLPFPLHSFLDHRFLKGVNATHRPCTPDPQLRAWAGRGGPRKCTPDRCLLGAVLMVGSQGWADHPDF